MRVLLAVLLALPSLGGGARWTGADDDGGWQAALEHNPSDSTAAVMVGQLLLPSRRTQHPPPPHRPPGAAPVACCHTPPTHLNPPLAANVPSFSLLLVNTAAPHPRIVELMFVLARASAGLARFKQGRLDAETMELLERSDPATDWVARTFLAAGTEMLAKKMLAAPSSTAGQCSPGCAGLVFSKQGVMVRSLRPTYCHLPRPTPRAEESIHRRSTSLWPTLSSSGIPFGVACRSTRVALGQY